MILFRHLVEAVDHSPSRSRRTWTREGRHHCNHVGTHCSLCPQCAGQDQQYKLPPEWKGLQMGVGGGEGGGGGREWLMCRSLHIIVPARRVSLAHTRSCGQVVLVPSPFDRMALIKATAMK